MDDEGNADIGKIQMMVFTIIGVLAYTVSVAQICGGLLQAASISSVPTMPDVGGTLLVLMGLAHATYVGNKLVLNTKPAITLWGWMVFRSLLMTPD